MAKESNGNISRKLSARKVILPMVLGLTAVGYYIYNEFNIEEFKTLEFTFS